MPQHIIRRSHGCITCRRRKIRCDQQRPTCQNCSFSGVNCDGYEEPTTFINDDPRLRTTSLTSRSKTKANKSSNSTTTESASSSSSSRKSSNTLISPSMKATTSPTSRPSSPPRQPQSIPFDPFGPNQELYQAFLIESFAIGIPGDGRGFSYLRSGLEHRDTTALVSVSVNALAQIYFGYYRRSQNILSDGLAKYTHVLRRIRDECDQPTDDHHSRYTLLVSILSALYVESVLSDTDFHWFAHCKGLSSLIERFKPESFCFLPHLAVFSMSRALLTIAAIKARRPVFVSDPDWKTIPWSRLEKPLHMKLWDIVGEIPNLEIELQGAAGLNQLAHIRNLLQQLISWRWAWIYTNGVNVFSVPSWTFDPNLLSETITTPTPLATAYVYSFDQIMRAFEVSLWNAMTAVLLSILQDFFPQFDSGTIMSDLNFSIPSEYSAMGPVPPSALPSPDPSTLTIPFLIAELLSTFDFQLSHIRRSPVYSYTTQFALCMGYRAVTSDSLEATKLRSAGDRMNESVNFANCRRITGLSHIIRKSTWVSENDDTFRLLGIP